MDIPTGNISTFFSFPRTIFLHHDCAQAATALFYLHHSRKFATRSPLGNLNILSSSPMNRLRAALKAQLKIMSYFSPPRAIGNLPFETLSGKIVVVRSHVKQGQNDDGNDSGAPHIPTLPTHHLPPSHFSFTLPL